MDAQPAWLSHNADALVLSLHVQPGARRTTVIGLHADRLKVAVAAPPADGRANAALLAFLAERLDIPLGALELVAGACARHKRVAVRGVAAATVVAELQRTASHRRDKKKK